MKLKRNKVKAWKEKRMHLMSWTKEGGWSYPYNKRIIRGWGYCKDMLSESIEVVLPSPLHSRSGSGSTAFRKDYPFVDCSKCPTSCMQPIIGVRSWTKRSVCPERKGSWGTYVWRPIKDKINVAPKVESIVPPITK